MKYSLLLGLLNFMFGGSCVLVWVKFGKKIGIVWILLVSLLVGFGFKKIEMKGEIIEKSDIVESIDLLAQ